MGHGGKRDGAGRRKSTPKPAPDGPHVNPLLGWLKRTRDTDDGGESSDDEGAAGSEGARDSALNEGAAGSEGARDSALNEGAAGSEGARDSALNEGAAGSMGKRAAGSSDPSAAAGEQSVLDMIAPHLPAELVNQLRSQLSTEAVLQQHFGPAIAKSQATHLRNAIEEAGAVQRRLFAQQAKQLEQQAQELHARHVKTLDKVVHTIREAKTLASEKPWLAMLCSGKYICTDCTSHFHLVKSKGQWRSSMPWLHWNQDRMGATPRARTVGRRPTAQKSSI